jgi:heme-degrading monooxygenase HmoA
VKPGMESQFVKAWAEFAEWSKASFDGAISATLLQDESANNRFISVGPWRSEQDVALWRESPGFRTMVGAIRELLESFEPGSFRPVYNIT